jgi:hypothetical protein
MSGVVERRKRDSKHRRATCSLIARFGDRQPALQMRWSIVDEDLRICLYRGASGSSVRQREALSCCSQSRSIIVGYAPFNWHKPIQNEKVKRPSIERRFFKCKTPNAFGRMRPLASTVRTVAR